MSHLVLRCKDAKCRAPIWWATSDNGRRVALDDRSITLEDALADASGVYFLDDSGRVLPWTPMIYVDLGTLYRAHRETCIGRVAANDVPDPASVPDLRLVEPIEPDPQLRMPVLPRPKTRRPENAGTPNQPHDRGNHAHSHKHLQAA